MANQGEPVKAETIVVVGRRPSLLQGVLLTCRSKFKAHQKSNEKKNDKLQNDDISTNSPTANEISKKRRLSFLRKRRKYSNNKDEHINLLNENEINKNKTDKTLKVKEDNSIVESKTSITLKDCNNLHDDSEKSQLIFLNEKNLIDKPEIISKEESYSINKNIVFKAKVNKQSNENLNKTQFGANTPCTDLVNLLDSKVDKNDIAKLEINESEKIYANNDKSIVGNTLSSSVTAINVHNFNNTYEQTSFNNYTEVLAKVVVNDSVQEASDLLKKSGIASRDQIFEDTKCKKQSQLNKNQLEFLPDVDYLPANKIDSSECNSDSIYKINLDDKVKNIVPSSILINDHSDDSNDLVISTTSNNKNKAKPKAEVNGIFIDENRNFLRDKHINKKNTDRPLSGYAEKLAELLADEDDLEFPESDEELNESEKIIKKTSNVTSVEPTPVTTQEINNCSNIDKTEEKSVASSTPNKKKNKRGRARGDRPMSLFEQDMLNDILKVTKNFEREEDEKSVNSNNIEGNGVDGIDTDDEILEDEILPVKATIEILRNNIVMPQRKISNYSDTSFDDYMRTHNTPLNHVTNDRPLALRKAAVLDAGCGILKAGICGETKPSCYCPSVIGVPRRFSQDVSKMKKPYYVGDEAWEVAGMLQIEHPIKQEINNWSDVTSIIEHLMEHELKINDNEHPILMTEMGLTSKKHREKLTEIMFEQFGVPSFYLANQSVLALYSMGMMSGVCLSSGFYNTQAIPIYEGHTIPHGISQLDIGGEQVTNYLGRLLQQSAQPRSFSTSSEKLVLNSMKQSLCYVSQDAKKEETLYKTQSKMYESYVLPDGQEIEVGAERFIAPEVLFDPHLLGLNQPSTTQLVTQTLELVNSELRDIFLQNILVTGGNTKLKGYSTRLEKELAIENPKIKITCADDPLLATWIGGSIMSSISAYRDQWMTIDQYTEHGSKLVHMLCF